MNYRALIIGCGNIGAMYDFDTDEVLTHAKAFSINKNICFSVADSDELKVRQVAQKYKVDYYTELSDEHINNFDIVSLCVNTRSHLEYLERISKSKVRLIICEKPIVSTLKEINLLKKLPLFNKKILVNYLRRFQPAYKILKKFFVDRRINEKINHISISYQRGILNNASHAIDLISYLLDCDIKIDNFKVISKIYDSFEFDPTICGGFMLNDIPVTLIGLNQTSYSIFELNIYLDNWVIKLLDGGNTIKYYSIYQGGLSEIKSLRQERVLEDYMVPVINVALDCLEHDDKTNFDNALVTNEEILKQIELI